MISRDDWKQTGRGLLMGGADIIPGVSGGTVALILGIYQRLVTAISRFDIELLRLLKARQWAKASAHVDLRFLVFLAVGIVVGIASLASLMHYLLDQHPEPTNAAFFGLIAASAILVARLIPQWSWREPVLLAAGVALAYWIVGLDVTSHPPDSNAYLFLCGAIAICAMILPGISGAFILLILGKYAHVTGLLGQVLRFQGGLDVFLSIGVFVLGCVCGLIGFSKLLKWLLERYEPPMLALLCGFMAGSLRKIWPFKSDLTPEIEKFSEKHLINVWPDKWTGATSLAVGIAVAAFVFVIVLDALTGKKDPTHDPDENETTPS